MQENHPCLDAIQRYWAHASTVAVHVALFVWRLRVINKKDVDDALASFRHSEEPVSMQQIPQAILNPLEAVLDVEAQPLLDTFMQEVQAASAKFVGSLPPAAEGPAALGVNVLTSIAGLLLQNEVNSLVAHNQPKVTPPAQQAPSVPGLG